MSEELYEVTLNKPAESEKHIIRINTQEASGCTDLRLNTNLPDMSDFFSATNSVAEAVGKLESIFTVSSGAMTCISKMVESINAVMASKIPDIVKNVSSVLSTFAEKLVKYDFSPLIDVISKLNFDIDFDRYEKKYLSAMFEAKWFPRVGYDASFDIWLDINEILKSTKPSKKRTKLIDECVYAYYTKTEVERIKRSWGKLQIPNYIKRILRQAVKAYHNGEYAVTAIVLASMWEGMVTKKISSHPNFKNLKKRERFHELVHENDFSELINQFYDEYIVYNCSSKNEVICDVPGRNASMHGWYNKYPSKKAALNAILFTDFLLKLKPIAQELEEIANTDA